MKIAFYAPIKPPDHHIPSGDRLIARNLVSALRLSGYEVEIASRFIAYSKRANDEILKQKQQDAVAEARTVVRRVSNHKPDIWVTYHPYCKAPDWIGDHVTQELGIPYVNVEAARTGQGFEDGGDRWAKWRIEAQRGIRRADLHLVFKPSDKRYLIDLLGEDAPIDNLAPFMDTALPEALPAEKLPSHWRPDWPVLMAVGMMRPGKKVENYRLLAQALEQLLPLQWNLIVAGGGPQQEIVEKSFNKINAERLWFTGGIEHDQVLSLMAASDLFVWPGWREPIGMVYLEAQLLGLPVIAFDSLGVPLVVSHGKTGLLAPENDVETLSSHIGQMVSHPDLRADYAGRGPDYVETNHSLVSASRRIKKILHERLNLA